MTLIQGLILGIIQGITEWLPISSEGINSLIMLQFFGKTFPEAIHISVWLHTGTVLAAVVYFRRDVIDLLQKFPSYVREWRISSGLERDNITTFLIVSTLLTIIVGAPLMLIGLSQEAIPAGLVMAIIGVFLIVTGLLQKYAPRLSGTKTRVSIKDAILLGVVQGFSALPGLSRSGLTVSTLLFRRYEAKYAIRISFLMSIPVVLAAEIGLVVIDGATFDLPSLVGILAAFSFGILTIGALLRIARRIQFWKFCLVLGVLSFLPLLIEIL